MKNNTIKFIGMALLIIAPYQSFSQYLQDLYDVDSSYDCGWSIFILPDSTYVIFGQMLNNTTNTSGLFNMHLSFNGDTILAKHILLYDNFNLGEGYPGEYNILPFGGYIAPITVQLNYGLGIQRSWAGIIKYNAEGETVFLKTYTDTALYYDMMFCSSLMPSGGYIVGGQHGLYTDSYPPGFLVRTDTNGNEIWTQNYLKNSSQFVIINSIVPLTDGRIAIGASSTRVEGGADSYYDDAPWFMLLDSAGNIIRDTVYSNGYQASGFLYQDMNGGYYTIGRLDYVYGADPDALQSFPSFIAHLDTNFRTTWQTVFTYDSIDTHREPWYARQLSDGSYVVVGDKWNNDNPPYEGWAAKVNTAGEVVWNHYYTAGDTVNGSYLRGVAEKAGGSLIFTGCSHNDTIPAQWTVENVWLLGVDSNGCENFWCAPAGIKQIIAPAKDTFSVFPNPCYGNITTSSTLPGTFSVLTIDGRKICEFTVSTGNTDFALPASLPSGIYMGVFKPGNGNKQSVVRLVNQP